MRYPPHPATHTQHQGPKVTVILVEEAEAEAILKQIESETPKFVVGFATGQGVRITDGPFADFNGVVEEVNYDKSRVQVSVLIFGRATPVELEFSQVEKD